MSGRANGPNAKPAPSRAAPMCAHRCRASSPPSLQAVCHRVTSTPSLTLQSSSTTPVAHGWQLQRTTTSINAATAGDTAAEELASQRRRSNVKRWIDKVAGTNRMACRARDQRSVTNT
jgi:hypothetical protein